MGSATREALAASRTALAALGSQADLATGEQLLAAGRVIGDSSALRSALVDRSVDNSEKVAVVNAVFAGLGDSTKSLLGSVASVQWSSEDDLLAGIEELGYRVLAASTTGESTIESELFAFGAAVSSDPELELAVSSKLGSAAAKSALVSTLLSGKASAQTLAIVQHLVQQPRGRRIAALLSHAASIVADVAGLAVATVTTATAIAPAQLERLATALASSYGRALTINHVIDPSVLGGLRVQLGDEVIDGTVATRLDDLRLQLAS